MLRPARWFAVVIAALALAACQDGQSWNPFAQEKPFTPTEVPADFAIIVDQELSTYYSRQHMQQVLAAKDLMSVSRYISYRDYNNTINNQFDIKQPLLPEQLQAMWNEVAKNDLLTGGTPWMNWRSEADLYRLNLNQIQIVANGRVKTYTAANGYPPKMRTLIRLAESVRLKSGQIGAPVVSGDQPSMPSTAPTTPSTGTAPESRPSVEDALTPPATAPTVPPDSAPSSAPATTKPGDQEAALPFDSDFQPIGICGNDSIFANDWEAVSASPAATTSAPATAPGR